MLRVAYGVESLMHGIGDSEHSEMLRRIWRYSLVFLAIALIQVLLCVVLGPWLLLFFPLWPFFGLGLATSYVWCTFQEYGIAAATLLVVLPWLGLYGVGCAAAAHSTRAYVIYLVVLGIVGTGVAGWVLSGITW